MVGGREDRRAPVQPGRPTVRRAVPVAAMLALGAISAAVGAVITVVGSGPPRDEPRPGRGPGGE